MTQNIYDTPDFFEGYSRLARSVHGLEGAPEWPALRTLVADVKGCDVVDLGCGFGWFCRWAAEQGAASVLGLDVSENMLARAHATTVNAAIRYERADLERLQLPPQSADLAYSSLTLHYLERLSAVFATVHQALRPGGRFVFSCEHPIYTAPARPGFMPDGDGRRIWPLNHYALRGERRTDWLANGVIKQHRTVADYVNLLIGAGFVLAHMDEWSPGPAQLAAQPALEEELDRPMMLLLAARR